MVLRRVVDDLIGPNGSTAGDATPDSDAVRAALDAAGHGDVDPALFGEALVHYADTAPLQVADALAPIVVAAGPVPIDPELDPPAVESVIDPDDLDRELDGSDTLDRVETTETTEHADHGTEHPDDGTDDLAASTGGDPSGPEDFGSGASDDPTDGRRRDDERADHESRDPAFDVESEVDVPEPDSQLGDPLAAVTDSWGSSDAPSFGDVDEPITDDAITDDAITDTAMTDAALPETALTETPTVDPDEFFDV